MKLQYLIIIFLLIMAPIYVVFSKYVDVRTDNIKVQNMYDSKLMDATYDAVKAFQSNTINSYKYVPESRVRFSKAAVNSFFTSLNLAFGFNGEKSSLMNEYVPAVVLTMYDGYYIYSPFVNTLTNVNDDDIDKEYERNKTLADLKPYITYSCNYKKGNKNYIITYSLDNYIIVDEFDHSKGTNGEHKRHEGYLIGLNQFAAYSGTIDYDKPEKITAVAFNGIYFNKNTKEQLKEYLIDSDGNGRFYYYTIRNGTKYYYSEEILTDKPTDESYIFYIDDSGNRLKQCQNYNIDDNKATFESYYNEIKGNTLAFQYYRDAFVFSKWVKNNLQGIGTSDIKNSDNYDRYEFSSIDNIFGDIGLNIEDSDSKFNQHRRDVIRAVIQTNLSAAISGFSSYSKATEPTNFIMPKISEEDWDLLENEVCIAAFLQGFPIGDKTYNNYVVVPNTKTKEFVDEDDICVIKNDNTYAKINEKNYSLNNSLGYYPGVWKINFELRKLGEKTYSPMSYSQGDAIIPYLESYSSMMGADLENITNSDMYKYIRQKGNSEIDTAIKKAYYIALGRERKGTFKFTNYDEEPVNPEDNNQNNPSTDQGETGGGGQNEPPTEQQDKIEIMVNYNANGGSGVPANASVNVGETFTISLKKPTKEGSIFAGWSDPTGTIWQPNETITLNNNNNYGIQNNILTLTAQWKESNYLVNSNGKYASTLAEAISLASFGDTITVVKNIADSSDVTINKDLTIDLNRKTLARNSVINISNGKTIIRGNGKMTNESGTLISYSSTASLAVQNVQLNAYTQVIQRLASGTGTLQIYNSALKSQYANTVQLEGRGNVNITDSTIVVESRSGNAIATVNGVAFDITISGNSIIECATTDKVFSGVSESAYGSGVYMINGGRLSVEDSSCIIGGPYTNHAVVLQNKSSVTFKDSSSAYAFNDRCISGRNAREITINTNGNLFAKGYVMRVNNCDSFNFKKGHLASVEHTHMTRIGDNAFNRTTNRLTMAFKEIDGYYPNGKAYLKDVRRSCNYLVRN